MVKKFLRCPNVKMSKNVQKNEFYESIEMCRNFRLSSTFDTLTMIIDGNCPRDGVRVFNHH